MIIIFFMLLQVLGGLRRDPAARRSRPARDRGWGGRRNRPPHPPCDAACSRGLGAGRAGHGGGSNGEREGDLLYPGLDATRRGKEGKEKKKRIKEKREKEKRKEKRQKE